MRYNRGMYRTYTYTAQFSRAPAGGYLAIVPRLPGCTAQGRTYEEVLKNIKSSTKAYLEQCTQEGRDIPIEPERYDVRIQIHLEHPAARSSRSQ